MFEKHDFKNAIARSWFIRSVGTGFMAFEGAFCRTLCLGLSGARFLCFSRGNPPDLVKVPCSSRKPLFAIHLVFTLPNLNLRICLSHTPMFCQLSFFFHFLGGSQLVFMNQRSPNPPEFALPCLSRAKQRSSPARVQIKVYLFLYGWRRCEATNLDVFDPCHLALLSPYSFGVVQIRVGLELAEWKRWKMVGRLGCVQQRVGLQIPNFSFQFLFAFVACHWLFERASHWDQEMFTDVFVCKTTPLQGFTAVNFLNLFFLISDPICYSNIICSLLC